ncbi:MAG: hypothetical protein C0505_06820 [Leptothrix sp. (in: Bacteria)]|nr:hypothetical protein [Leptothrix sp. (in: b-proteobacteria)]
MMAALAVLGAVLGLLLLLLAVPVGVEFRLRRVGAFDARVTIRWLFGLVRLRAGWPMPAAGARRPAPARRAKPGHGPRGSPGRALRLFGDAAFRRRVVRLVRDLVAAARLRDLSLHARLGLGDPADTGRLWALIGPLNAAAQGLARCELRVEPDFGDPVFEFDARGAALLVPLRLLALGVAFVLSPATLRAWRAVGAADG